MLEILDNLSPGNLLNVTMGVFSVFGIMVGFLGFLCALRYARPWKVLPRRLLKVTIFGILIATMGLGYISIVLVNNSLIGKIILSSYNMSLILSVIISVLMLCAISVGVFCLF